MSNPGNQSPRAKIKHYSDGERKKNTGYAKVDGMIILSPRRRLFTLEGRKNYIQHDRNSRKQRRRMSSPVRTVYNMDDDSNGSNLYSDSTPSLVQARPFRPPRPTNTIAPIPEKKEASRGTRGVQGVQGERGVQGDRGERGECICVKTRHISGLVVKNQPKIMIHTLRGEYISNIDVVGSGYGKSNFSLYLMGIKSKLVLNGKMNVSSSNPKLYRHQTSENSSDSLRIYQLTFLNDPKSPKELYSFNITIKGDYSYEDSYESDESPYISDSELESEEESVTLVTTESEELSESIDDKPNINFKDLQKKKKLLVSVGGEVENKKRAGNKTSNKMGSKVKRLKNGMVIPLLNINHRGNNISME